MKDVTNHPRFSWVVWEEDGRYPNLIIELLSASTSKVDRTLKKELYQNRFRTPEYFWFSPNTQEFMERTMNGRYLTLAGRIRRDLKDLEFSQFLEEMGIN